MKFIIAISTILTCTVATPSGFITPIAAISAPISSQYHAQDGLGQYTYGYTNPLSAKTEARSLDGAVLGSYSYVDAYGKIQSVEYAADDQGFRVAASNLPVAPGLPEINNLALPIPVQDTPEVIEARNKHLAAVAEAKNRAGHEGIQEGVNNSVEIPAARSLIAVKSGNIPVAITSSLPVGSPLLPLAYRPALYSNPAVAVKSFITPAIAVKTNPVSTAFSYAYGINNLYNYGPALYNYPAYTYATHIAGPGPQAIGSQIFNTIGDTTVVENAELAREKSVGVDGKEDKSSQ